MHIDFFNGVINMKNKLAKILSLATLLSPAAAFAQEAHTAGAIEYLPIGAALAIGLAALGGTLAQGKAISSALESIARNPSASGDLKPLMILGLVFIESLVIFSFVVSYLLLSKI